MQSAAFEVRSPDGHVWKVYADGRTEGFPEGSTIFNRIPQQAYAMRAESCPTSRMAEAGLAQR